MILSKTCLACISMILKIISVGLVTVVVSSIIKQYRADLSLLINICGAVLIVLLSADGIRLVLDSIVNISQDIQFSQEIISPLIKVLGIGYITEFSADIAEDAGNKSISSKIVFGGKIAICVVALPIIIKMLSAILSLL